MSVNTSYAYDNAYRLVSSTSSQWFNNNGTTVTANSTLTYQNNGRITSYTVSGTTNSGFSNYVYNRGSNRLNKNDIYPAISSLVYNYNNYYWDANGNMEHIEYRYRNGLNLGLLSERFHYWDEDNRMQAVKDNDYSSYYFYDHSGERTWKIVGPKTTTTQNGQQISYNRFNQSTLYLFPEVTVTAQGYTKHIFAGTERICSKTGCGLDRCENISTLPVISVTSTQIAQKRNAQQNLIKRVYTNMCYQSYYFCLQSNGANIMASELLKNKLDSLTIKATTSETIMYFYHTDHLGSSSLISNAQGAVVQAITYLPMGGVFKSQGTYNTNYTFNGKFFDTESGYHYYGARYYDSKLGIWLSVDPLAHKYPMFSPYAFCANSPIMFYDPDGRKIEGVTYNKQTKSFNYTQAALARGTDRYINARMETKSGQRGIMRMHRSLKTFTLNVTDNPMFIGGNDGYAQLYGAAVGNNIYVSTAVFNNNTDYSNSTLINNDGSSSNISINPNDIAPQLKDLDINDRDSKSYLDAYKDSGLQNFDNNNPYKSETELIHGVGAHEEQHTKQSILDKNNIYKSEHDAMRHEKRQRQEYINTKE
jgi:RHS repeat-associated protein